MNGDHGHDANGDGSRTTRRRFLAAAGAGAATGLAGCGGILPGGNGNGGPDIPSLSEFRGSGTLVEGRDPPGGTSIEDLPDLSGSLNLYIGGGEGGIYTTFIGMLEEIYPDFSVRSTSAPSSSQAQNIVDEVEQGVAPADVFWSIDASSLAFVANNDAYESLPSDAIDDVPSDFRGDDGAWAGVAGRARSVPYNTNALSESDIPNKVREFPDAGLGTMGWAPTYGAFKSFVTAMRLIRENEDTKSWLESMADTGIEKLPNEAVVSRQVANGELDAGFANHYYAMRVKNDPATSDPPIDLAFTEGDAGALVNVAGALKIKGTDKDDLVANFVRHLLSSEAQEFFATVSFAYPMIPDVAPVGELPPIDQLSPPDIDLAGLADLEPTLDLMREAGVLG